MPIDQVFRAFLETNTHQGARFGVGDLASFRGVRKIGFRYFAGGVPYAASLEVDSAHDADWPTLTLGCSKFHLKLGDPGQMTRALQATEVLVLGCRQTDESVTLSVALPPDSRLRLVFEPAWPSQDV